MLLAGDLGGTKTSLAIISPDGGPRAPLAQATLPSADYPSLEALVREFLDGTEYRVDRASFGVAGPVVNDRATITNLHWVVDADALARAIGLRSVRLMNDLVAIASAVPHLGLADLHTVNEGVPEEHGAIAVIAPGTGLGEAYLTWDGRRYRAHPSEGGHSDFAPINDAEIELLRYLRDEFGHVSYERVCSGIGIPNIYDHLKDIGFADEEPWLAEQLATAHDRTPIIMKAAVDAERPSALCQSVLRMFVGIMWSEAGNLALKTLATGGVFVGGGIPPRILPFLEGEPSARAFRCKGRLEPILSRMPVHVITNPGCALLGAAYEGMGNG